MPSDFLTLLEATSVWQIYNYVEQLAASRGQVLLKLNLDETAICAHPGSGKGAIFATKTAVRRGGCHQHAPRWKRRCYINHIAMISERDDVQLLLPQFIIGNGRFLLRREMGDLEAAKPPNVVLLRRRNSWCSGEVMVHVVKVLGEVMAAVRAREPHIQPLLLFDAMKAHLTRAVLRACKAARVWVIVIPPRMTPLLQPLDAHVFALYKDRLIARYQAARMRNAAARGDVDAQDLLQSVYAAIDIVIERKPWACAFERCGFGARQALLSENLRSRLGLMGAVELSNEAPSMDQLAACIPRSFNFDTAAYRSLFDDAPQPLRSASQPSADVHVLRRTPRTRSEHQREAAAVDAVVRLARGGADDRCVQARPLLRRYRFVQDAD